METARNEASDRLLTEVMRATMPNLKTQAQFDGFLIAFDALRMTVNGIYEQNGKKTADGKEALAKALDALTKITEVSEKLREVPEAATSAASEVFKNPPAQFGEDESLRVLLDALSRLESLEALDAWYMACRAQIHRVVTPSLRNQLFDAIRERKVALS